MQNLPPVVSCEWLKAHLNDTDLIVLDASMPDPNNNGSSILGSLAFDYANVFCDQQASLPCTMPSAEYFSEQAQRLGINQHSTLVVYDQRGLFYAPRAWWMFKSMGFDNVHVLAGGLPKWQALDLPCQEGHSNAAQLGNFQGAFDSDCFVNSQVILDNIKAGPSAKPHTQVVDVRSAARFNGTELETRPGLRSGHIPHSVNFPFSLLIEAGEFKSLEQLAQLFNAHLPDKQQQYIFSCGSGVTACITLLAAHMLDYKNLAVYDGSWTDWGANSQLPVIRNGE